MNNGNTNLNFFSLPFDFVEVSVGIICDGETIIGLPLDISSKN